MQTYLKITRYKYLGRHNRFIMQLVTVHVLCPKTEGKRKRKLSFIKDVDIRQKRSYVEKALSLECFYSFHAFVTLKTKITFPPSKS